MIIHAWRFYGFFLWGRAPFDTDYARDPLDSGNPCFYKMSPSFFILKANPLIEPFRFISSGLKLRPAPTWTLIFYSTWLWPLTLSLDNMLQSRTLALLPGVGSGVFKRSSQREGDLQQPSYCNYQCLASCGYCHDGRAPSSLLRLEGALVSAPRPARGRFNSP